MRLEIVEPGHDIIFVLPIDQILYFRILLHGRLDMIDKAVLDFSSFGQIQLQIDHCGLDMLVSQFIADNRDGVAI